MFQSEFEIGVIKSLALVRSNDVWKWTKPREECLSVGTEVRMEGEVSGGPYGEPYGDC